MFSLPAQGLNELPMSYFMNAAYYRCNLHASEDRDCKGFVMPETSKIVRKGQELLWPAYARGSTSAADYNWKTAANQSAAFLVDDDIEDEVRKQKQKARENEKTMRELREQNAALSHQLKMAWHPLREGGGDVGKTGIAYFQKDERWVEVRITSFTPLEERDEDDPKRGMYKFHFDVRNDDGKLLQDDEDVALEDFDFVSVGSHSVRVQDDDGCWTKNDDT